jgi:AraC-like DNA-binding protein
MARLPGREGARPRTAYFASASSDCFIARVPDPVLAVALDSGFGDLSTVNARFRATFRMTPSTYRVAA